MADDPIQSPHQQPDEPWAALSSLADGEATRDAQERCLALWPEQAAVRARWRQYQLIGDVLRSQELAQPDAHDAAFLSALRSRLASEPVVLRPPLVSVTRRLKAWATPMAAAAGVAAVAGVVVMLRSTPAPFDSVPVAGGPSVAQQATQPQALSSPVTETQRVNGRLIRDARLERYFSAHRQSGSAAALQMPGGVVRSVDTIVLEDR
jgi:sigma-E factor negative regulatory protein RseA